jgi:hypothetical protein
MTIAIAVIPDGATITGIAGREGRRRRDLTSPRLIEDAKPHDIT